MATTPLGRDENGKNLVAYIVRTQDDPPAYKLPGQLANSNYPKKSFLNDAADDITQQEKLIAPTLKPAEKNRSQPYANPSSSASFIKPDELLSRLEQSQVNQLRIRNDDIRRDTTELNDGNGNALLTTFVYNTGPDGRRYAVGVSAPLLSRQTAKAPEANTTPTPATPSGRAANAYQQLAYVTEADFRSGLLNKSI